MKRVAIIAAGLLTLGACTQSSDAPANIDTTTSVCQGNVCTAAAFMCDRSKRVAVGVVARNNSASDQAIRIVRESSHSGTPDEEKEGTFQPNGHLDLGITTAPGVTSTVHVFNGDNKEVATIRLGPADACKEGDEKAP